MRTEHVKTDHARGGHARRPRASGHAAAEPALLRIEDVMTPVPLTIGREQTLATAHTMMRSGGVRHLPVLEHGELIGVVSQRDLYLLETIGGVDPDLDRVDDAMTTETYAVPPSAPVEDVTKTMAREKYGCAVVMERDRVIGIFTATDALRLLAQL